MNLPEQFDIDGLQAFDQPHGKLHGRPSNAFMTDCNELIGQRYFLENPFDVYASYLFVVSGNRHDEHAAKIDRRRADREFLRFINTRAVFASRKNEHRPGRSA